MIDREKVIKKLAVTIQSDSEKWNTIELPIEEAKDILALLKEQETVVRCKDCKHKPTINKNSRIEMSFPDDVCPCLCDDPFYSWCPKDNWFCGNGESR